MMKRPKLILGIPILAGITLLAGILHGKLTNRWGPTTALVAAADALEALPDQFGPWRLQSTEQLSSYVSNMLQCSGSVIHTYVNDQTHEVVKMAIVAGPPGPISVHTPEICYSSRAFTIRDPRKQVPADGSPAGNDQFWALTFRTNDVNADSLRVYYAWKADGAWVAAEDPRYDFGGQAYLYKIQLASFLLADADREATDPCRRFLNDFLPIADPILSGRRDDADSQ